MEFITWIVTITAIIGVIYNIKKRVEGFYLWTLTNTAWVYLDAKAGLYSQAFLFIVYTGLSIYGILVWRKESAIRKEKNNV
jgi:nicotinamide riboside transporter PnuC